MTFYDFKTTSYGKWILAGEHAVVRGHEALVFPLKSKQLTLSYRACGSLPTATYSGDTGSVMQLLFWSVMEHGVNLLGRSLTEVSGTFHLDSNIPVGSGMGASAALCVAIARWFSAQHWIEQAQVFEFAKSLEHLFHGKSSGLDIAGVSSEEGVFFKAGQWSAIHPQIQPHWHLSSCNQQGLTSQCVQQVQELWERSPYLGRQIDLQMVEAVFSCKDALEHGGAGALEELATAIDKAATCFFQWGLVSESLLQHMNALKQQGALAVKPTGSGGGGYVLSLWDDEAEVTLQGLIKI